MPFSGPITPSALDVRWSHDLHGRLDYLAHTTRLTEGNPCFVIRTGGNGQSRDKRAPWLSGEPYNLFAAWLMSQTAVPFDVLSIGTPQAGWDSPATAGHLPTTKDEQRTRAVVWPESVAYMQAALQWIKSHSVGGALVPELGATLCCNGRNLFLVGDTFGALLAFLSQAYPARQPRSSVLALGPQNRFGPVSEDSTVRGIVTLNMVAELRRTGLIETVYWDGIKGLFGTTSAGEWDAIPETWRASCSPRALIQSGKLSGRLPPLYLVNEYLGNHVIPFGDPATGAGASISDRAQLGALVAALTTAGMPPTSEEILVGAWADETAGPLLSARVYAWARNILGL